MTSPINLSKKINIVVPCYQEEENIARTINGIEKEINEIKNIDFNILLIDDGSNDESFKKIKSLASTNKSIKGIKFSRNFGSHNAISAGIDFSKNYDAIICIPGDYQEPPSLIKSLIEKWVNGNEVVWSIRKKRKQSIFGKLFSKLFYFIFLRISYLKNYPKEGPSGCFLLDKKIIYNWGKIKETNLMAIGMIVWMGFKQSYVEYNQLDRMKGKSSYSFGKLFNLAINTIVSFSYFPIRLISFLGILFSIVGFVYAIFLVYNKFYGNSVMEGWTSLMVIILFLGGIQLLTLGIIGEYIWRGVDESKQRPTYLISEKVNIEE